MYMHCCCSVTQLCLTLCDSMDCSTLGLLSLTISKDFPFHAHCIGDAIQPSHPLMPLLFLPSIFLSIRDFSNESAILIRWPQYWSFTFSISPSNEYSGLISLKIDCFDLLAFQGTFRSLLWHNSLKASILWCSTFFTVQLSQMYKTNWKTIVLTMWAFVGKVMSLHFNTLHMYKYKLYRTVYM